MVYLGRGNVLLVSVEPETPSHVKLESAPLVQGGKEKLVGQY